MKAERQGLRLLPPDALLKTGEVDHADWNYRPLLGTISRTRFRLVVSLLDQRMGRLLEVGYGSGVFMPELARFADELYGIDIHQMTEPVAASLARFNVNARLFSGSVEALPFDENFFDCIVAVSALEFVSDTAAACREIKRALKPGGALVVVTPGHSPLVDFGLKLLTGKSAKEDYDDRRQKLMPTLLEHFRIERELTSPAVGNSLVKLYTALRLRVVA
ncbi:MAG: class I SAM-dependent methyltransferase [Pyrinomonadaceae bacterium]